MKKTTPPTEEGLEFEPIPEEGGSSASPEIKIKKLKDKLKETEDKAREYLDGWQRAKADYANLQKQELISRQNISKQALKPLLLDLINLADTFDLALSHEESLKEVPESWRLGIEHIHKELLKILEHNGLDIVNPLNQPFDPLEHHSVGTVETNEPDQDNKIVRVLKKGYRLGEQVIRPAQVTVAILKA